MNRRTVITLASSGVAAAFAGCADDQTTPDDTPDDPDGTDEQPTGPGLTNPSFEDGLDGWTIDSDVPSKPGESDEPIEHEATIRDDEVSDGEQSLHFYLEGAADDGTIWAEQQVDFTDVEEASVDVYSAQESFNIITQVAFFAGEKPDDGLQEAQFNRDEDIQDHEGWKTYTYDVSDVDGEATLAVGMNIVWETGYGTFFDNISLN